MKKYLYNPLSFYIIVGFFALTGVIYLDRVWLTWENKSDILVEFHGLLFDVLFFGILFTVFSMITSRVNDIRRYKEQIDDLKGWDSEEATFKIIANLKRLLKLNAKNIDLNNCYLVKGKLNDLTLENIKIENSTLGQVDFKNSILRKASFENSNLNNGNLTYADLHKANFTYALAFNSFFQGANLSECCFENATMNNSDFELIELKKSWDDYQEILDSILKTSYLNIDDIEEGEIIRANLTKCNFSFAILDESNLNGVIARESNFNGASLTKSSLKGARLVKADLRNTNLSEADLDNANLEGAQFQNTNLKGAILTNVNLRNVAFQFCDFEGATFSISQKEELIQKGVDPSVVNWI